jgi:hypothetical protein
MENTTNMQKTVRPSLTPSLRTFISKVITPVVLLAGLLVLVVYNFNGVLKAAQTEDDHYHGLVAYNQGPMGIQFKQDSGIDRPLIRYNTHQLLSYAEWSSTISVDGTVNSLWDTDQNYQIDEAHNRIYSTASNSEGWDLSQITTLKDDHTVTVSFTLATRPTVLPVPTKYVIDIVHVFNHWNNPVVKDNTFTGDVTVTSANNPSDLGAYLGKLTLTATSDGAELPTFKLQDVTSSAGPNGMTSMASAFVTEYTVLNPKPDIMMALGTETITFDPGAHPAGAPVGGPNPY